MCRSIQQLRGAEPPPTPSEIRDAALQYVRKISGYRVPSQANAAVFDEAVGQIAEATAALLDGLVVPAGSKTPVPVQRRLRQRQAQ
ncbi:hypothetical protein BH23ACT10_BH23ACT10_28590 [soil metagenome]